MGIIWKDLNPLFHHQGNHHSMELQSNKEKVTIPELQRRRTICVQIMNFIRKKMKSCFVPANFC